MSLTCLWFCLFIAVSLVLPSTQVPPRRNGKRQVARDKAAQIYPPDASILDILKTRPAHMHTVPGKAFKDAFYGHPEVRALQSLKGQDYVNHSLELRKVVESQNRGMKTKFRKAIAVLMEDHKVDKRLQLDVKARLRQVTKIQADERNRAIRKQQDPTTWAQRKNKYAAKRYQKLKVRKETYGDASPFEAKLKEMKLPDDASASQIEQAFRKVVVDNNIYTTMNLGRYLAERFPPDEVQNVMAHRSYHLGQIASAKDYQINAPKRMLKKLFTDGRGSGLHTGEASRFIVQSDQQKASASDRANLDHESIESSSGPATGSFDPEIDPLDKHFHHAEWWNDLYKD